MSMVSFPQSLMFVLQVFIGACLCFGIVFELLGMISMVRFYFRKAPPLPHLEKYPGLTLIKPCYGTDENEKENFENFFLQKYKGPIQLLFVVSDEKDTVVPIIRDYLLRFPQSDAQLIISKTRRSFRRKVDALFDGHAVAKHELILWSDSDVMIREDYVEQVVASLLEPGVSIVTTPQYDLGVHNVGSALKVLSNNCDVGTYITFMDWITRKKQYAWGHSLAFKKKEFLEHEAEAWDILNRFLADDQSLPYLFAQHGKQTVLRNIYCPVHCGEKSWKDIVSQKRRWAVCQRLVFPNRFFYICLLLVFPQITSALLMILNHFSAPYVALFFGVAALKVLISFEFEFLFLRSSKMTAKYFWTICVADLLQIYYFSHAFLVQTIQFHGKNYRVVDKYFLEEIQMKSDPLEFPILEERRL